MSQNLKARVDGLVQHIEQGKILEAMNEFYSSNVSMQENNNPPSVGLAKNIEREKQFLGQVKQWKRTQIVAVGIDESRGQALIRYEFDFVNTAGQEVHYDQVSAQIWRDGKIVNEKFYYDTGAKM